MPNFQLVRVKESTHKKILRLQKRLSKGSTPKVTQAEVVEMLVTEKLEAK